MPTFGSIEALSITGFIQTHKYMDPYISTGKESIEKERVRINRYISCNKQEGNQR